MERSRADGETIVVNIHTIRDRLLWPVPPANYVYIGRGSKWGNPYRIGDNETPTRRDAVERYGLWLLSRLDLLASIGGLRGKQLGCFCKPQACHGDVLVKCLEQGPAAIARDLMGSGMLLRVPHDSAEPASLVEGIFGWSRFDVTLAADVVAELLRPQSIGLRVKRVKRCEKEYGLVGNAAFYAFIR